MTAVTTVSVASDTILHMGLKQSVDLVTVTNERDALRSALNVAVELLQRYTTDEFGDDVALNDDIDAFLGVDPP